MANPVGTGPYLLKDWRRGAEDHARGEPDLSRAVLPGKRRSRRRARSSQVMKGKRIPMIGRIEMIIIEESNPRLLAFIKGELDVSNPVPPDLIYNVLDAQRQAQAGAGQARHPSHPAVHAVDHVRILQHGRSDRRRLFARDRSRCDARSAWRTTSQDEINVVRQGQGAPATQIPAASGHRLRPEFRRSHYLRSCDRECAARQDRLRRARQRRMARPSRWQAVHAHDRVATPTTSSASSTSCGRRA